MKIMNIEDFDILEQNLKNQPGSDYFAEIKNRSIYKRTKCQSVIQKDDDCKFINPELEKAMKQVRTLFVKSLSSTRFRI